MSSPEEAEERSEGEDGGKQNRRAKERETGTERKALKEESGEAGRNAGEVYSRAGTKGTGMKEVTRDQKCERGTRGTTAGKSETKEGAFQ